MVCLVLKVVEPRDYSLLVTSGAAAVYHLIR
jgi:hypothetical protein